MRRRTALNEAIQGMTKAIVRSGPMSTPAMNMKSPAGWPYIWTTIGLANAVTKLSTRHTCPMMMIPPSTDISERME